MVMIMDKMIYTKYSYDNRDVKFQCRTMIKEKEDGSFYVLKGALHNEGSKHIMDMLHSYKVLRGEYKNTNLKITECTKVDEKTVGFAFIKGNSLEEILDTCLAKGDFQKLVNEIKEYFDVLFTNVQTCEFYHCDRFKEIFGDGMFDASTQCVAYGNIDAIFSNVKIYNSSYYIIDYEWCFDFPIPLKFIMYRAISRYTNDTSEDRTLRTAQLKDVNLYKMFEISEKERKTFEDMESSFQKYVIGGYIPEGRVYDVLSNKVIRMNQLINLKENNECRLQIYEDYGTGFAESTSYFINGNENSNEFSFSARFSIREEVKSIRIDPSNCPGILILNRFTYTDTILKNIDFEHNAVALSDSLFVFIEEDPQIIVPMVNFTTIDMDGYYIPLNQDSIKYFSECIHSVSLKRAGIFNTLKESEEDKERVLNRVTSLEKKFNRIVKSKLFKLIKWHFTEDEINL